MIVNDMNFQISKCQTPRNCVSQNMSLNVSINTDEQGVFDTLLENGYALMTLALKKAKDENNKHIYDIEDIYEWIDYVCKMGLEQVFDNDR